MKRFIIFFISIFAPITFFNLKKTSIKDASASFQNPVMSIVIDDFGSYDQAGVETMLSCSKPLTCAVLPNVDNTQNNIEQISKTNHELILHMPMQSHVYLPESWYGPVYITNYDDEQTAINKLNSCLNGFENAKGFNIHIGSGVSRNEKLMTTIYNWSKEHNLYFLDSRTIETQATENACKNTNSIYLGRDEFLEADKNKSYANVKFRLLEGAKTALEKGYSIVIGHVGAEGGEQTARAIIDTIPEIENLGVEIVPLSTIYNELKKAN